MRAMLFALVVLLFSVPPAVTGVSPTPAPAQVSASQVPLTLLAGSNCKSKKKACMAECSKKGAGLFRACKKSCVNKAKSCKNSSG